MCVLVQVFLPAGYQRPWRSRNADSCWRFERRSITAVSRPRVRSRHRFVTAVRNPHRGQLAGAQELRQADGIASVGLHAIAWFLWDQRWRNYNALVPEHFDLPMQLVTRGPGLVAERDPLVFGRKLANQLGRRRSATLELAEKTNLTRPTAIRNRDRITQLRGIERYESFAMIAHDFDLPCLRLYPAKSGQPS